jgi:hypothetical protein
LTTRVFVEGHIPVRGRTWILQALPRSNFSGSMSILEHPMRGTGQPIPPLRLGPNTTINCFLVDQRVFTGWAIQLRCRLLRIRRDLRREALRRLGGHSRDYCRWVSNDRTTPAVSCGEDDPQLQSGAARRSFLCRPDRVPAPSGTPRSDRRRALTACRGPLPSVADGSTCYRRDTSKA